jgi:hypothetical protein
MKMLWKKHLVLAALTALATAYVSPAQTWARHHGRTPRGIAVTDGLLTPGSPETLTVRRMPKRLVFAIEIAPPLYHSSQCPGAPVFCIPAIPETPDGRPAHFRTSGHGRATVVFTMPTSFDRMSISRSGPQWESISFAEGDVVQIRATGVRFVRKGTRNRSATTLATVALGPTATG